VCEARVRPQVLLQIDCDAGCVSLHRAPPDGTELAAVSCKGVPKPWVLARPPSPPPPESRGLRTRPLAAESPPAHRPTAPCAKVPTGLAVGAMSALSLVGPCAALLRDSGAEDAEVLSDAWRARSDARPPRPPARPLRWPLRLL